MAKARSFAIFLLKDGYTSPGKALEADHGLKKASHEAAVGETWPTYLASKPSASPWWRGYFCISDPVAQGFTGAIVLVEQPHSRIGPRVGHGALLPRTLATKAEARHDLDAARDLLRQKDARVTQRHYIQRSNVRVLDPRSVLDQPERT